MTLLSNGNPTLSQSLHDGWQVARLNLSQFQGQTIKLRFANPWSGVPRTRLDKVAILTPRAQLSAPVTITGTTYLDTPLTGFDGPTTTAFITITTMTVYDEYVDMSGQIAYNHQNYPFSLTGDIYRAMQGTPNDKVVRLQSLEGFSGIHFEARSHGLLEDSGNPFIAITLSRNNTREITNFAFSEDTEAMVPIIESIFATTGRYTTAIQDEYQIHSVEAPIFFHSDDYSAMNLISRNEGVKLRYRIAVPQNKGKDEGMCMMEDRFYIQFLWNIAGDIYGANGFSDVSVQQKIIKARTYLIDDPQNDSECSSKMKTLDKTVFRVESPASSFNLPGSVVDGNTYNVENFSYYLYWVDETVDKNPQIYMNFGIPLFSFVSANVAFTLEPENFYSNITQNKLALFDHIDLEKQQNDPNYLPDIENYRTRLAVFSFDEEGDPVVMNAKNQTFFTTVKIQPWKGASNHQSYVKVGTGGVIWRHGLGIHDPVNKNWWVNTDIKLFEYAFGQDIYYSVIMN